MNKDLFGNEIIDYDLLDVRDPGDLYMPQEIWDHPDQLEFNFDEKKVGLDIKQMLDKAISR